MNKIALELFHLYGKNIRTEVANYVSDMASACAKISFEDFDTFFIWSKEKFDGLNTFERDYLIAALADNKTLSAYAENFIKNGASDISLQWGGYPTTYREAAAKIWFPLLAEELKKHEETKPKIDQSATEAIKMISIALHDKNIEQAQDICDDFLKNTLFGSDQAKPDDAGLDIRRRM